MPQEDSPIQPQSLEDEVIKEASDIARQLVDTSDYPKSNINRRAKARAKASAIKFGQLARQNAELAYESTHDELTGVLNLKGLEQELEAFLRDNPTEPSLLFIDGTNVKAINDRLGHDKGDEAITGTAEVLRRSIREGDTLARVGGDEFVVLLRQYEPDEQEGITNERTNSGLLHDLNPVEMRIEQETKQYLDSVKDFVDVGFDIAVGWSAWDTNYEITRNLAEQNMMAQKSQQHAIVGQHRQHLQSVE